MGFPEVIYQQPIVILGSPRSGTSLISSIFDAHGVWNGTTKDPDQWNPKGYFEHEMLNIPRLIAGHGDGLEPGLVYDIITYDGYQGGKWFVKHSPLTWRAWRKFKPTWVIVRRRDDDIVRSRIRTGQWDMDELEHRIGVATDIAVLEGIVAHMDGVTIWPEKLLAGDFEELEDVFLHCGIDLDQYKAKSRIDPSLWGRD